MGGVNKSATYVSTASNANILVFSYTIASGDTATTSDRLDKPPQSNHLSHHHSHHLHWRLSDHYNHSLPHHDVNGDGLDDLIVGAHQANLSSGKSYVVFGKQDTNAIELSAIAAGTGGFVINGESEGDWSGCSVSNAGDVNGDGLDDMIVHSHHLHWRLSNHSNHRLTRH
jgi:hypothetical protein